MAWAKGVAAAAVLARAIGVEREELLGQELDRVRVHLQKGGKQRMLCGARCVRVQRARVSRGRVRLRRASPICRCRCRSRCRCVLLPTAAYYWRALPIFLRLKIMYSEMATVPLSSAAMTWQGRGGKQRTFHAARSPPEPERL